jgi:Pro-kumamolisin, activation domain
MKLSQYSVPLAILIAVCEAIPAPAAQGPHEKRSTSHATRWRRSARVDGDAVLPIRIGLTQNELDKGYSYLMDVLVDSVDPKRVNSDPLQLSSLVSKLWQVLDHRPGSQQVRPVSRRGRSRSSVAH